MRFFFATVALVFVLSPIYGQEAAHQNSKVSRPPANAVSQVVIDLWVSYAVVKITSQETSASTRVYGALQDHGASLSQSLSLLDRSPGAMDALIFVGSLSLDGFLAEDLSCAVLAKGRAVKAALAQATNAKKTPCEEYAPNLTTRSYVHEKTIVPNLCKSPGEFRNWAGELASRVDRGDRCSLQATVQGQSARKK